MSSFKTALFRTILLTAFLSLFPTSATRAQEVVEERGRAGVASQQADDVIRINTELVQTEVMVFDRKGRFVDELKPEQFELSLNGAKQAVTFFERVTAGSASEAVQLAAARGRSAAATTAAGVPAQAETAAAATTPRGRVIFFFLDDVHLSGESMARAREALRHFVNNQMNPNDQVAIASTSGQVGFLQQLTDNPAVLNAAIARLSSKRNAEAYTGKTQISEYLASQVEDYANKELFAYLMESVKMEQQMGSGNRRGDHKLASTYSASPLLRNRLRQVNAQGRMTTEDTLGALQSLLVSSEELPGRKVVFFLSDGFIINERKSGALFALRRVTEAAARAGAVIYTMDLRGTFFNLGSGADASTNDYADMSSRKAGLMAGEIAATQEPLKLIADETGGRAVLNSNAPGEAVLQAIGETSEYYVLAWRPDSMERRESRLRLQVRIKDRPDLRVRLRSGLYNLPPSLATETTKTEQGTGASAATTAATVSAPQSKPNEVKLLDALGSLYPRRGLPVALAVGHLQTPNGAALKISMQVERQALGFDPDEKKRKVEVDVLGAAIDDRGQLISFKQLLTIVPEASPEGAQLPVVWNQQLNIKPGLYQVRVAVRERASGRTGSVSQWIEVPNEAAQGRFQLSSLFLGERKSEATVEETGARAVTVDVDHKFARTSVLRFQTYVYNAARGRDGGPEVWIQTQVFRNRQQIMTVAPGKVPVTSDAARLPYWTEIALDKLPAGQYTLQVAATDRVGKTSALQRINFSIE